MSVARKSSSAEPVTLEQQLYVTIYKVEQTSYHSLELTDIVYPYWIASHVWKGEVEMSTGGELYFAGAGTIMIHPPNTPFSEKSKAEGTHQWFGFDATFLPNVDLFQLYPIDFVVPLISAPLFSDLFSLLLETWQENGQHLYDVSSNSYASALLMMMLNGWRKAGAVPRLLSGSSNQDRFGALIQYMKDHLEEKLNRSKLAALCHLHPVYLDRTFLESFGLTPMQMLRDIRLKKATQLLGGTGETMAAIAVSCGLGDAPYLNRLFLSRFGLTPGEYRESSRSMAKSYLYGGSGSNVFG